MSETTRLGLGIVGAAVALGVAGDALLRETPWGINTALWALVVVVAVVALAARAQLGANREAHVFLALALLFAAFVAWRASPVLTALNLLAALGAFSFAVLRAPRVRGADVTRYLVEPARLVAEVFSAPFLLAIEDVRWAEVPRGRWTGPTTAALRGLAIALPIFLVFLLLFVAADAVFEELVTDLFDIERPLVHLAVWLLWTWIALGLLRHALGRRAEPAEPRPDGPQETERKNRSWFGGIETMIVLGVLNALFLAFVLVQLRYLFGGDERVQTVAGLTYAEYARRGFFELVAVAALVLPLLLLGDWVVRRGRRDGRTPAAFRALSTTLVLLLFVVMASALERMRLYVDAYGLTELRLYSTAFMLWLAAVFVVLLPTVLRARPKWFALGGLVAATATLVVLNAINPDALIANQNIDRRDAAAPFDAYYIVDLSDDATPTLIRRLDDLPPKARGVVAREALATAARDGADWRTWNWGRSRARAAAQEHHAALEAALDDLP